MGIDKAKLHAALATLDHDNDEHWTQAGKPSMAAIESAYGSSEPSRQDVEAVSGGLVRGGTLAPLLDGGGNASGAPDGAASAPAGGRAEEAAPKPKADPEKAPSVLRPPRVKRASDPKPPGPLTDAQKQRVEHLKAILADTSKPVHVRQAAQRDLLSITAPREARKVVISGAQLQAMQQNEALLRAASEAKRQK